MKSALKIIILGLAFVGLILCLSIQFYDSPQRGICPYTNIVELGMSPIGPLTIWTEKDCYNEKYHSLEQFLGFDGWLTLKEYEAYIAAKNSI